MKINLNVTLDKIQSAATALAPFRNVVPGQRLKVAFFDSKPDYHAGSFEQYWAYWYPQVAFGDPGWEKNIHDNFSIAVQLENTFKAVSTSLREQLVQQSIQPWAQYANVNIEYVADPAQADIRIGLNTARNVNFVPGERTNHGISTPGDIFLKLDNFNSLGAPRNLAYTNLMHEFGHALGLSHVDGNGLVESMGSMIYSVVGAIATTSGPDGLVPKTPMLFDIVGLAKT